MEREKGLEMKGERQMKEGGRGSVIDVALLMNYLLLLIFILFECVLSLLFKL